MLGIFAKLDLVKQHTDRNHSYSMLEFSTLIGC